MRPCDIATAAAAQKDLHNAFAVEQRIYEDFVKAVEDEDHYLDCFAKWRDVAFALGRHFRLPEKARDYDTETVNFFLHAAVILGHTEVLLKLLEHRPEGQKCKVWVFHKLKGKPLEKKLHDLGVECVSLYDEVGEPIDKRILWFRDAFRREKQGILVWVSMPCWATTVLAMRIAPIQVYYSLRFHPITLPVIDKYITGWGSWNPAGDGSLEKFITFLQQQIDDLIHQIQRSSGSTP